MNENITNIITFASDLMEAYRICKCYKKGGYISKTDQNDLKKRFGKMHEDLVEMESLLKSERANNNQEISQILQNIDEPIQNLQQIQSFRANKKIKNNFNVIWSSLEKLMQCFPIEDLKKFNREQNVKSAPPIMVFILYYGFIHYSMLIVENEYNEIDIGKDCTSLGFYKIIIRVLGKQITLYTKWKIDGKDKTARKQLKNKFLAYCEHDRIFDKMTKSILATKPQFAFEQTIGGEKIRISSSNFLLREQAKFSMNKQKYLQKLKTKTPKEE